MALAQLKALEDDMKKCFRCNQCKIVPLPVVRKNGFSHGCPANLEYLFQGYSGGGKQIMALSLLNGRIEADKRLAEITNACTTCGLCDVSCKFIMEAERNKVNMTLREHMVETGFTLPEHERAIQDLENYGHPGGWQSTSSGEWANYLNLKILPREKADVLLFAGHETRSDPAAAATAVKLAFLLLDANVNMGILGDKEPSSGMHAHMTGYRDVFTKTATRNSDLFDTLNVKTIVTASATDFGAFVSKYPEYAKAPKAEVLHATQFLWQLIKEKRLLLPGVVNKKVTYHDPCYLGRQSEPPVSWNGSVETAYGCMTVNTPSKPLNYGVNGIYDEPRNIIKAIKGIEFTEMYRIREYAFCCGGGGGVPEAYPMIAKTATQHRIDEARDIGATHIITACHTCRKGLSRGDIEVMDIIDLVFEASKMDSRGKTK